MRKTSSQLIALSLLWLILTILAAAAVNSDAVRSGRNIPFFNHLKLFFVFLTPLYLLSIGLTLAFARTNTKLLQPKNICLLYLFLLLTFLPGMIYYELLVQLTVSRQKVPPLPQLLGKLSGPACWVDGMVFSAVYAAHVCHALWRQARLRMAALQAARNDNLALRLSILQGQLEPRFLLGSLDGISDMVRDAEQAQALRALARLSDLLRNALRSSQRNWLSVADEISFMRDYLALQELRFGTRLQVHWAVEENDWANYTCPALLLHQFIEQTISDGLRDHTVQLILTLAFSLQGGAIRMMVRFSSSTRNGNIATYSAPTAPAIQERLKILFGAAGRVESGMTDRVPHIVFSFPACEGGDD